MLFCVIVSLLDCGPTFWIWDVLRSISGLGFCFAFGTRDFLDLLCSRVDAQLGVDLVSCLMDFLVNPFEKGEGDGV